MPLVLCWVHLTHTHAFPLGDTHTQLPDLISGLCCPVSLMIGHFPFSHQATVLPSSCMGHLLQQVTKDCRKWDSVCVPCALWTACLRNVDEQHNLAFCCPPKILILLCFLIWIFCQTVKTEKKKIAKGSFFLSQLVVIQCKFPKKKNKFAHYTLMYSILLTF